MEMEVNVAMPSNVALASTSTCNAPPFFSFGNGTMEKNGYNVKGGAGFRGRKRVQLQDTAVIYREVVNVE